MWSHRSFQFQLRIDVNNKESFPVVRPYVPGTPLDPPANVTLPYPITLTPREKQNYNVPTESFNVVAMLSNPMMLLMAFAGVMVFAMPYLMVRGYGILKLTLSPSRIEKPRSGNPGRVQGAASQDAGDAECHFNWRFESRVCSEASISLTRCLSLLDWPLLQKNLKHRPRANPRLRRSQKSNCTMYILHSI